MKIAGRRSNFLRTARIISWICCLCLTMTGCKNGIPGWKTNINTYESFAQDSLERDNNFLEVLEKHLKAVTSKDLTALKSTLSPKGDMLLILPGAEIINGVDGFVNYHRDWFKAPNWTFETKILNSEIGSEVGMAIVEIIYKEPERDGKPYFNRMIVSYVLQQMDGKWYVIKDHASSVEKSTDIK